MHRFSKAINNYQDHGEATRNRKASNESIVSSSQTKVKIGKGYNGPAGASTTNHSTSIHILGQKKVDANQTSVRLMPACPVSEV